METTTMLRGASELRRVAHRYWMAGLGLSVTVHLSLLTLAILAQSGQTDGREGRGIRGPVFIPRPTAPYVAGITPRLPFAGGGLWPQVQDGTPVPVENISPDRTLPTQRDRREPLEPVGEPGTGGEGEEIVIPPDPEAEPEPFVPVEKDPVLILGSVPEYPSLASSLGLEGRVWVKIWVDTEGRVRKAVVLKSSAEVFEAAALKAAMEFLFTPAIMNGKPVSVWVSIPFQFRLKG